MSRSFMITHPGGWKQTVWPLEAFGYYHKLQSPVKKLLLLEDGKEYTVLSSKGEDNIDRLKLRPMFNLAIRRTGK